MGFLQMAAAALGSFVAALLPYRNAFGMIALFGGFVALGLAAAVFAVRYTQPLAAATAEKPSALPGAPASTMGRGQVLRATRGWNEVHLLLLIPVISASSGVACRLRNPAVAPAQAQTQQQASHEMLIGWAEAPLAGYTAPKTTTAL